MGIEPLADHCQRENGLGSLNVGVVGAGKMGLLHAGIFNSAAHSRLISIAEKGSLVSRALRSLLPHVRVYDDYSEMLDSETLDIVVICTPVFLHKSMVESALERRKHVLVEKPLAMNALECQSILERIENQKTMVAYCRRFMPTYQHLKQIIDSGDLGAPSSYMAHLFVSQVFSKLSGWQYDVGRSGGGVMMDLGCHAIDLLHHLFGDIASVNARGFSLHSNAVEDFVSSDLESTDDLRGHLDLSWSVKGFRLPELKLVVNFENGVITATEKYLDITSKVDAKLVSKGRNSRSKQELAVRVPIDIGGPEYTLEDMHFLDCILNDREPLCNFYESSKVNAVIDAVYSSMSSGQSRIVEYPRRR
jgi:predicted dehydrogenase